MAGLFDTVYVSLYKGLGGIAGCCLAGPVDVVEEVRAWRTRHGGRLFALWPYAAPALAGLRTRLPRMAAYREHALACAAALRAVPRVAVVPDPPQTSMMHLRLSVTVEELRQRGLTTARQEGVWTWATPFASDGPDSQRVELSVGDATLRFPPAEVARLVGRLT